MTAKSSGLLMIGLVGCMGLVAAAQDANPCGETLRGRWIANVPAPGAPSEGDVVGTITGRDGVLEDGPFDPAAFDGTVTITFMSLLGEGQNITAEAQVSASNGSFFVQDNNLVAEGGLDFATCAFVHSILGDRGPWRLANPSTVNGTWNIRFDAPEPEPEPDPEPDPDEGPCPDAPPPLEWLGEASGAFDDAESWDEERVPGPDDSILLDDAAVDDGASLTLDITQNTLNDSLEITDLSVVLRSSATLQTDYFLVGLCRKALGVFAAAARARLSIEESLSIDADAVIVAGAGPDPGQRATLIVTDTGELTAGQLDFSDADVLVDDTALLEARDIALAGRSFVTIADAGAELRLRTDGELNIADDSQFTVSDGGKADLPGFLNIDVTGDRRGFVVEGQGSKSSAGTGFLHNGRIVVSDRAEATFATLAVGITAENGNSDGKVFVNQAALKAEEFLNVGLDGNGLLEARGGTIETAAVAVGGEAGGEIALHGPGSSLRVADHAIVGGASLGAISLDTGAFMETQRLTIGQDPDDEGFIGLGDVSTTLTVEGLTLIGKNGNGSLVILERASLFANGVSTIAAEAESVGSVTVSGGTVVVRPVWEVQDVLNIGFAGKGDLFIHNFGEVRGTDAVMGVTETGNGLVDIQSNGRLILTGELRVGDQGIGTLQLDSTATVSATVVGITSNSTFNGTLIQIGGAAAPQGINLGSPKPLHRTQVQEEQGELAPGLYARTLLIQEGATINADAVTLDEGGTIGGAGRLAVAIENRGRLQPGDDACDGGILSVGGDYVQTPDATLDIAIAGTQAAGVLVEGEATLGGTLAITLVKSNASPVGESFEILTASSVSGTFDQVEGPGEFEVEYAPESVRVSVLAVRESELVECSESRPRADAVDDRSGQAPAVEGLPVTCGAGLCGAGMVPMLALLGLTLAGWKRTLATRSHHDSSSCEGWRRR